MAKQRLILRALILILVLLSAGCGSMAEVDVVAQSEVPQESAPEVSAEHLAELAINNQRFAWDLYGALRDGEDNLLLSPYSLSLALAMTYEGARGETAQQMAETLHFSLPREQLHPAFNALTLALMRESPSEPQANTPQPFRLQIVNALWGQRGHSFLPEFLDPLVRHYGAGLRLLDFAQDPEAARATINTWVSEQTETKIPDLLPEGTIRDNTRLVLTNAIYFYGSWRAPFETTRTEEAPFYLQDGSQVPVPLMHQTGSFRYAEGAQYQIIELPYMESEVAMIVLLPRAGQFAEVEATLNVAQVETLRQEMAEQSVTLALPKFRYTSRVTLADTLAEMGMPAAFGAADFSGMDGTHDLAISAVLQQAVITVDEAGTEAAAATAVVVGKTALTPAVQMIVDRPFIFLIRDNATGTLLFVGRVLTPTQP